MVTDVPHDSNEGNAVDLKEILETLRNSPYLCGVGENLENRPLLHGWAKIPKYIMSDAELKRFIQHYERITHYTLNHLPAIADVVSNVAAARSIIPATRSDSK